MTYYKVITLPPTNLKTRDYNQLNNMIRDLLASGYEPLAVVRVTEENITDNFIIPG